MALGLLHMQQGGVTHSEDSAVRPLPYVLAYRRLRLPSVAVTDWGEKVCHSYLSHISHII